MIRLTTLLGIPIIVRSIEVVATMSITATHHSLNHRLRLMMFAVGYAILAGCTMGAIIDAWSHETTWREFGFVVASALLILGDKRKNVNRCFRRDCDAKEGR